MTNKNFETIQRISDTDLATRGIVRISPSVHVGVASIESFDVRPEGILFIRVGGVERQIPNPDADRVLGMILAAKKLPVLTSE